MSLPLRPPPHLPRLGDDREGHYWCMRVVLVSLNLPPPNPSFEDLSMTEQTLMSDGASKGLRILKISGMTEKERK